MTAIPPPIAPTTQEFFVGSLYLAAWLIVQNHLRFLRCERAAQFDRSGRLTAIFVFANPDDRGRQFVHQFVHGNPSANVKKLREVLSELRAELLRVNNSPSILPLANALSRVNEPELHGGSDE